MREFKQITVSKKCDRFLSDGHIWVYGNEIVRLDEGIENGEIVDVFSEKKKYLGSGFYNGFSKIAVRILSVNANDTFDEAFFARRIRYAIDYRRTVMQGDLSNTRLVFGDADMLPGLIIDKFGDVLVTQIMCLGMEQRKQLLFEAAIRILREYGEAVSVVYERNDVEVRKKEGLAAGKGYFRSPLLSDGNETAQPQVLITENGVRYSIDYINGQKTGFFLDQKFNRLAAASIAQGKTVLDCFTHTGAFAMNCYAAGAKSVTAVDISEDAISQSKANAALNGMDGIDFICADVFDFLDALIREKRKPYDYIILDPPAFTKSTKTVNAAYHGYKQINLQAMRLLPRGGYLATCSCSHFMTDALFRKMLLEAATEANVRIRIAAYLQQAKDHPVLLGVPETEYLKFYIVQVV